MAIAAEQDVELALELAGVADELTLARYRAADLRVDTKPDLTPVTEADRAVEEALRRRLSQMRPDDAVIGEELTDTAGSGGSRRWIIDPIDGTASYLRGMPIWATLIALEANGEVRLGVTSMPALGRRWWAVAGGGAFCDGEPMRVSAVTELADAQLCWSGIEAWDEVGRLDSLIALGRACWRTRGVGDAWQYMLVAEGAAEIALDPSVHLWDLAAVKVIVEEAGGRFTDLSGAVTAAGGSSLASNGLLHDAAMAFVGTGTAGADAAPDSVRNR
jgi:histidinol-phosphatase